MLRDRRPSDQEVEQQIKRSQLALARSQALAAELEAIQKDLERRVSLSNSKDARDARGSDKRS